jgi:transcriptional regulator with XRE-family HTH domain
MIPLSGRNSMTSSTSPNQQPEHELGAFLRYWRRQRGKSQLDLSLDTGVSQRHISFVESGRSVPSRELLLSLAKTLDVPLREQNVLLLASGYAPVYLENTWDAPEMAIVTRAIDLMLRQHEPHPALVLDRYWNILKTNDAAPRFFGSFVDLSRRKKPRNLLHLMFDPNGMRPFVEDWAQVASGLLQRVYREAVGHVNDKRTFELLDDLNKYPGVKDLNVVRNTQSPVVPITFVRGSERTSYFSIISTVGLPQDITAQELRIECMFPAE